MATPTFTSIHLPLRLHVHAGYGVSSYDKLIPSTVTIESTAPILTIGSVVTTPSAMTTEITVTTGSATTI